MYPNVYEGVRVCTGLKIRGGHGSWPPQRPRPDSPTVVKDGHRDWEKLGRKWPIFEEVMDILVNSIKPIKILSINLETGVDFFG